MATVLMGRYRVRPGAVVNHGGALYAHPDELDLPRHVAAELPHLMFEIDVLGEEVVVDRFDAELASARPHERISMLKAEQMRLRARLADVDKLVQAEESAPVAAPTPRVHAHAH